MGPLDKTRACHFHLSKGIGKELRTEAREWIEGMESVFEEALKVERPRRAGEPFEHDRDP